MKIKWRYGIAFPLILTVALGGLSAWLGKISTIEVEEIALNPNEPQYSMTGIKGTRFDDTGHLKENIIAQKAWQLPKSTDIHFSNPLLSLYQKNTLQYQVKSQTAVYNTENKQAFFDQDVILTKSADGSHPSGIFKTNNLHIDTNTEYAQTKSPVTFEYGQSHGSADGMNYDHKKGLLNFPSKVKATIYDAKTL